MAAEKEELLLPGTRISINQWVSSQELGWDVQVPPMGVFRNAGSCSIYFYLMRENAQSLLQHFVPSLNQLFFIVLIHVPGGEVFHETG